MTDLHKIRAAQVRAAEQAAIADLPPELLAGMAPEIPCAQPGPAPDDWQHLKPYGYAPGGYMSRCRDCGDTPIDMDKRATRCRPCAEAAYANGQAQRERESEAAIDAEEGPLLVAARKMIAGSQPLDSCQGGYVVPAELWLALQGETMEQLREHARRELAPAIPSPEGGPDALALAHRIAWRYKKSTDPAHSDTYTFNEATLLQFVAALAAQPQAPVALTEEALLDGFCMARHSQHYASVFIAGARFAERAHGIPAPQTKEPINDR